MIKIYEVHSLEGPFRIKGSYYDIFEGVLQIYRMTETQGSKEYNLVASFNKWSYIRECSELSKT